MSIQFRTIFILAFIRNSPLSCVCLDTIKGRQKNNESEEAVVRTKEFFHMKNQQHVYVTEQVVKVLAKLIVHGDAIGGKIAFRQV